MNTKKSWINNNNGTSTFTNLLLIIVIGVIIWQFILPALGYSSLTDYIEESGSNTPLDLDMYWLLKNTNTEIELFIEGIREFPNGQDVEGDLVLYYESKSTPISIEVNSNIPYSLLNPYTIRIIHREIKYYVSGSGIIDNTIEFISDSNVIAEWNGKLTSDSYIYNCGSEIRLNDGITYVYGNFYEIVTISPNNEIISYHRYMLRMDD